MNPARFFCVLLPTGCLTSQTGQLERRIHPKHSIFVVEIKIYRKPRNWYQDLGRPRGVTKVSCGRVYARDVRLTMLDRGIYAQLLWYLGQTIIYFPVLDVIFGSWAHLIYMCDTTHATQRKLLWHHCFLCCMLAMGTSQHATLVIWVRYKRSDHTADITCVPSFYVLFTRTAPQR